MLGHQGHARIVSGLGEQPGCRVEILASLAEPILLQVERCSVVQHGGLTADLACLAGCGQGKVSGPPPVVEVSPGLEDRFRAERQAPAQLG